ncbi:MAG: sigma 54-interacting transcriptional regulator [Fibrobacter sp.]|jgi:Nif-specific regulatory protein|uniref:sigma-54 interaction domain-containing protein n=3 Tax=Fibrobacter sp. TaxID=35828 RepID=UPI001B1B511F|nr:sigma 54-interacting transcriptional regulator [Fibrobacter sp.]MBO5532078.1 sigma 54-interacting transcriptional regulator [Fibrobacter sp.]MBR6317071.1 sigma 54-interacting transcriptional regulator [Fibrobacter sp.]MDY6264952.1 sigma 54-interacting transcriptional regulator [Fibrobacter sp.]
MPTSQSKILELELLYKISSILNQTLDFESVAHPILEVVESTMGVEHATLTLYNRHTGEISIEIAEGLSSRQARKGRYKVGEGITGRVVETGKPVIIPSVGKDPNFLDRTGRGKDENKAFLCVPVIMEHQVIGAFSADVQNPVEDELPEKLRLLEIIAQMLAAAVKLRREAREENELLKAENERLTLELKDRFQPDNIIGRSSEMQRVYAQIDQVSKSPLPALIVGEVGTGKGLVAEAIHYRSDRNMGPFVRVHCASMPESVLDRELFGSVRGALVGVFAETPGRVEQAEGGTLFLDEVGELSPNLQVKLLRLLQNGEVERIGARISKKVNVRVIAATTKNLQQMVEEGAFREDLYYQLHIFPIYVPPLRNRKTDIVLLADHFVEHYCRIVGKNVRRLARTTINMLMSYPWPGNVRELENGIERAVLVADEDVIYPHHFPTTLQTAETSGTPVNGNLKRMVEAYEKDIICDALKSSKGKVAAAARSLSTTPRILTYKINQLGIDLSAFGK